MRVRRQDARLLEEEAGGPVEVVHELGELGRRLLALVHVLVLHERGEQHLVHEEVDVAHVGDAAEEVVVEATV